MEEFSYLSFFKSYKGFLKGAVSLTLVSILLAFFVKATANFESKEFDSNDLKLVEKKTEQEKIEVPKLGNDPKLFLTDLLQQRLNFVGVNKKPYGDQNKALFQKTSGDELVALRLKTKYFVSFSENNLDFSESRTPITLEVIGFDDRQAFLKACLTSEKPKSIEEDVIEVSLSKTDLETDCFFTKSWFDHLKKVKYFGEDKLLKLFNKTSPVRLSLKSDADLSELFVGEYLSWDGKSWKKVTTSPDEMAPLAKLESATGQEATFIVWDPTGFVETNVSVAIETEKELASAKLEELKKVKQRGRSRVFCKLDKKQKSFKTTDWLLFTSGAWKVLKGRDLENYLQGKLKGELLVFQGVTEGGQKRVLKGQLFDSMRSKTQEVSLPLKNLKKRRVKASTKNQDSTTINGSQKENGLDDKPPLNNEDEVFGYGYE